jgi:hypothetical protein
MSLGLPALVLVKFREQVERLDHLLGRIPADALPWQPPFEHALRLELLLGHLLECLAGVCATLYAAHPEALPHFTRLRTLPVNHACAIAEARSRIREYHQHIEEGFGHLSDADLARRIPTVFVPAGEAILTLLLGNLEHVTNHKYQLFVYLKMLGVPVSTADLYAWRGPLPPDRLHGDAGGRS